MPSGDEERGRPMSRLDAQIDLLLNGIPGVEEGMEGASAWPEDFFAHGEVRYLYRENNVLVRDSDIARVLGGDEPILQGAPVEHDRNMRGLTRIEFSGDEAKTVEETCALADRRLGKGVVTPDHIFYVTPGGTCPATEPEEVRENPPPDPGVSAEPDPCRGDGVLISVLDSGFLPDAAVQHPWLAGVTGEEENPLGGSPPRILPYAGHGTFVAGVARTMAPGAYVRVHQTFRKMGAVYESDLISDVAEAIRYGADIISLAFGSNTRSDIASLGFDVVGELLQQHPGIVLVAAAGNDASRQPFWPAAFPWVVGVGALSANWRSRAYFSNFGPWVDVYAPGEGLVNAFATGDYQCTEPPHAGEWRHFDGMARWSGTSFSTPLVAGLVAARMSGTGENAPDAAQALLARARDQAIPGVGPVILPGQACDDRHPAAGCCRCGCGCRGCRGLWLGGGVLDRRLEGGEREPAVVRPDDLA
jgi:Subtilase family